MGSADSIFQDLANQDPTGLARLVLGDTSVRARGLPASLPIVRRRDGDVLLLVTHRREDFLLHVECEHGSRDLGPRLLEYVAILAKREHRQARREERPERAIVPAVFRLRGSGRAPHRATHEVRGAGAPSITLHYLDLDVRGLDAEALLASGDPALLAFVPPARNGDQEEVLARAVAAIEEAHVPDEQRAALATSIWVLAGIVGADRMVSVLLSDKKLRRLYPGYDRVCREIETWGEIKALTSVLKTRLAKLGRPHWRLKRKIADVTDVAELERLITLAFDVETLDDFKRRAFPRRGRVS